MAEIKLNSQEWTDFVFENKNKEYGAYELRSTSGKRHFIAIGFALLFTIVVAMIPIVMKAVSGFKAKNEAVETIDITRVMTVVDLQQQEIEKPLDIPKAEPIPPIKPSIKFTPPVIAPADEVDLDVEVNTVDEITNSTSEISLANIVGEDRDDAISYEDIVIAIEITEEGPIPDFVEQMPQFPGGTAAMMKFISDNLSYPVPAQEAGKQGRVTLKFVVGKDGTISNVEVVKGIFPACDIEAVRVIKKMPKWNPGRQNGKAVAVNFNIPVVFKLQ